MSNLPNRIPQPKAYPLLRNLPSIDSNTPVQSMMELAKQYGPFFRLEFPGRELFVVCSQELVNELCDEQRFDKKVHAALWKIRDFAGDGLFTANTQEPNWSLAHRILMPAFGPASLQDMFDSMVDIAEQMLLKWEREGPAHAIDVADNFTRLTLDTIALCAFDYRFNSFYERELHPFVGAMVRALNESGRRSRRLSLQTRLMLITQRQYTEDIRVMHQVADELIAERRKNPAPDVKDLLNRMLLAADPITGERLSDENIRYQMVTFLIAGHETTSGMLSFTLYELLQNPECLAKARAEVEAVLGNESPRFEHLSRLVYLDQVLKESLRLWPTAPAFAVHPKAEQEMLGGCYPIQQGQVLFVLLPMLHRDPLVWGDDVETFNPDRMAPELFEQLPPNAWKPFGNGQRACIGRPFAMQEALLILAMILQRFDLAKVDANYQLKVKETLTLKPEGFFVTAKRRSAFATAPMRRATQAVASATAQVAAVTEPLDSAKTPMQVLFGSNSGSCESFAQRIATEAHRHGYRATTAPLDSAVDHLSKDGPVIIVTATYEGQPPDNARQFVGWLDSLPPGACDGVHFAVFGCGNRDWTRTYQAIPKRIDSGLTAAGASRLVDRGEADAREGLFSAFDAWSATLWNTIGLAKNTDPNPSTTHPALEIEFVSATRDPLLRVNHLETGFVVENRELVNLSSPIGRSKRHLEITLPTGMKYRSGDYLAVLPTNPPENVDRVLRRFGLSYDAQIMIHRSDAVQTFLPTDQPVMIGELISSYVELGLAATPLQIEQLAVATPCPPEKKQLERWIADKSAYTEEIQNKRVSILDLLERFASCGLPLAAYLQMLQPLKPRQYSISSSPLWSPDHCTLTLSVISGTSWSGQGTYFGVASNYLAQAKPGTKVAVAVRPSNPGFHLPDHNTQPIIMVAAGSGVAPFRGFIQELALRGTPNGVAPCSVLLYYGCCHPDVDYLYRDEFLAWEQEGFVQLRPAFSRLDGSAKQYVQDRLWTERAEVMNLIENGAKIFVCGEGRKMAPAVRETFGRMHQERTGADDTNVERWLTNLESSIRYVVDVFG
ncbi:bifunctional cytochrome P450/NADPH--P450 reductase [Schlesneria paludicola]|uniref:bifunctional cytochrome P450/NADPH--P450 reductase n=1 Tax=Schlesneria paludicola TaxID=360056 RepID=UPI00029A5BDC|nr:cytochrome P450 [Schlesneria paludicola]